MTLFQLASKVVGNYVFNQCLDAFYDGNLLDSEDSQAASHYLPVLDTANILSAVLSLQKMLQHWHESFFFG